MKNYSPNWLNDELCLPKDRTTLNAWARAFVALNPIINSTVEFYSKTPLKFLSISETGHEKEDEFWLEQKEIVNFNNTLYEILREIWTLGEVFPYLNMNESRGRWSEIIIQNPDYIIVKSNLTGESEISLRPDERLRSAVFSKNKMEEIKGIDPKIISAIKDGKNIALNRFYVAHLAIRLTPYETRGTTPIFSVLKLLVQSDNLRAAGANKDDIKYVDDQIKQAIGFPYQEHGDISKDIIVSRVLCVMNMLQGWLKHKFFAPIAKINEFYKDQDGKKILSVPSVCFDVDGFRRYLN